MEEKDLVICPVYNEGVTFSRFFLKLRKYYPGDLLFVNDGSTDITGGILSSLKNDKVLVISNEQRKGYGAALIKGFRFAVENGYERVVTIDADLRHDPARLPLFFRELACGEVVLGSRYLLSRDFPQVPKERLYINGYIADYIKSLSSVYFSDPFCGYRGYRSTFLEKTSLLENGYGFSLEVLLEIIGKNIVFKEIPVEVLYPDNARSFLDGLDDKDTRLAYYLEVISRKVKRTLDEQKSILNSEPASR